MIAPSKTLDAIEASRKGRGALVIVPSAQGITHARRYLENHGAAMEQVCFCTPDTLHLARDVTVDVVVVDGEALRVAAELGLYRELTDFVDSVRAVSA